MPASPRSRTVAPCPPAFATSAREAARAPSAVRRAVCGAWSASGDLSAASLAADEKGPGRNIGEEGVLRRQSQTKSSATSSCVPSPITTVLGEASDCSLAAMCGAVPTNASSSMALSGPRRRPAPRRCRCLSGQPAPVRQEGTWYRPERVSLLRWRDHTIRRLERRGRWRGDSQSTPARHRLRSAKHSRLSGRRLPHNVRDMQPTTWQILQDPAGMQVCSIRRDHRT